MPMNGRDLSASLDGVDNATGEEEEGVDVDMSFEFQHCMFCIDPCIIAHTTAPPLPS